MRLGRLALALLAPLAAAACAAVPAERLGTAAPRSPVAPAEQAKVYPIDVYDPLEGVNRRIYQLNARFDRWVFLPAVGAYTYIAPPFVQDRIGSFFNNLSEFRNGANAALQGKREATGHAIYRLFVNSTLGVAGLFDAASVFGVNEREEDFGQTLGHWGVPPGPYLVLPVLGPSSARDGGGLAVDTAATNLVPVVSEVNDRVYFNAGVYVLYAVDQRRQTGFRYYRSGSPFEYDLVRFLYTKKRELDILR